MKPTSYLLGAIVAFSAASASALERCENWQFLLQSDTSVSSALLTGEINQSEQNSATFTRLHDVHTENLGVTPIVSFSVDLDNAGLNRVSYQIQALLPVDLSGPGEDFNVTNIGPLREGYISLHQQGDAKFTLYAQRTAC